MNKNYIVMALLVVVLGAGTYVLMKQNPAAPVLETASTDTTPAAPVAGVYTLADVAQHASAASCWTTIDGNVYDVTEWIGKHPGGSAKILGTCGKDASAMFDRKHGGQPRPEQELANFKIGTLGA